MVCHDQKVDRIADCRQVLSGCSYSQTAGLSVKHVVDSESVTGLAFADMNMRFAAFCWVCASHDVCADHATTLMPVASIVMIQHLCSIQRLPFDLIGPNVTVIPVKEAGLG